MERELKAKSNAKEKNENVKHDHMENGTHDLKKKGNDSPHRLRKDPQNTVKLKKKHVHIRRNHYGKRCL